MFGDKVVSKYDTTLVKALREIALLNSRSYYEMTFNSWVRRIGFTCDCCAREVNVTSCIRSVTNC